MDMKKKKKKHFVLKQKEMCLTLNLTPKNLLENRNWERFWRIQYNDESLVKKRSNVNVNTAILELSNISNILEQKEPTINDARNNLTKQERKELKEVLEDQNLVITKADKGNTWH